MQVTLQLRPRDADAIKRIAITKRRTPRRMALQMLREAIANQPDTTKKQEAPIS